MTTTEVERGGAPRLLPWSTPEGKPCFLISDNPKGFLSRRADDLEQVQLALGAELLERVGELVDDPAATDRELRFALRTLSNGMVDALRVAESRGARLCLVADMDDTGDTDDSEAVTDE
ncbi:hypothetical protein ACGF5O_11765 [Streptomyces sp. NPDC048291]|uniref:hypothetical protein n=1 Tax=Streptomyces sp. NPDC048291 TaxID=3365530 RepID=UPI0037223140